MKIGIDARMYGPEQGGLGRYVEQLIKQLESLALPAEFVIFLTKKNWDTYQPAASNFHKVLADVPWYGWREQTQLTTIINSEKVDLMHFPHWNVPLNYRGPFVVTIHDLILLHYPTRQASHWGPLVYWLKTKAYRWVLNHAARQSKQIIVPSLFTKNDIAATLKVPADKIALTYLGLTDSFHGQLDGGAGTVSEESRNRLNAMGINKPYVLYVGVAYPHKNLDGLVAAWGLFNKKYGADYQLVLAGKTNFFYQRLMASEAVKLEKNVIFPGYMDDQALQVLYQNASLFVMPSFYEGFGLPPLEAMSYGVPVVSSNAASLPEILGNAAHYFSPGDFSAMAEAIEVGLTDQDLRQSLRQNAKLLLPSYNWRTCAEKTWEIYQKSV